MIRTFLRERRSWIAFFTLLQLLVLSVAYIDSSVPFTSVLYIVFITMFLFAAFLIRRYQKETKFFKKLTERNHDLDITSVPEPERPFERIVETSILTQTKQLRETSALGQLAVEQEKDEMLAWIHEVKTPLTAMHLIIDRLQDEQTRSHLTHEWLRIHLLLDQQLHQKRIPFMENDLYIESILIEELIFLEIKTLQSWCMRKNIGFDVHFEAPAVLSDAKWLSFIIRQILTNAVKYSSGQDIIISSRKKEDTVTLEIKDFGCGIDPRDMPRIFEKGFTSTRNHRDQSATGMGLYLAKKAAAPLLIAIEVDSEHGISTSFTLTFPKQNDFVRTAAM